MNRGSCHCRKVKFTVAAELRPPDACHCTQCRKQSGHFSASTDVLRTSLTIEGEENISWYRSSEKIRRGFCSHCGSQLFWDPIGREKIAITMGAFDGSTGTKLAMHIFVADKGDYYEIADGLPCAAAYT
jgi:hypothetical protein